MGLFSYNYSKAGPGVDKNAPRKKGVFLFFELLGRKFFKLMQAMWICGILSIPYLVLMFLFIVGVFGGYFLEAINNITNLNSTDVSTLMILLCGFFTVIIYTLWGSGPASAGFAYVTRCFTREEHSWILSDFLKKTKENLKQSLMLVLIDFIILYLVPNAIVLYWKMYVSSNQFIWLVLMYVCIMALIVYTFMHFHIYQIMVTFDCKFKDLIKNSLMLACGKSPINLLLAVISVIFTVLIFNVFHPIISMLISVAIIFGVLRFTFEFYSARTVEKLIDNSSEEI